MIELEAQKETTAALTGTEYEPPENQSAMRVKAALYAIGNGLMNAAVEVGGGIQTLPDELKHGGSGLEGVGGLHGGRRQGGSCAGCHRACPAEPYVWNGQPAILHDGRAGDLKTRSQPERSSWAAPWWAASSAAAKSASPEGSTPRRAGRRRHKAACNRGPPHNSRRRIWKPGRQRPTRRAGTERCGGRRDGGRCQNGGGDQPRHWTRDPLLRWEHTEGPLRPGKRILRWEHHLRQQPERQSGGADHLP